MKEIEIIVPWSGGCPHRERALAWLQRRLPITLAPGGDPWVKASAVMPAIVASDARLVALHDADCYSDGLADAVQAVRAGHKWAIPHWKVHRLTEVATDAFLRGDEWAGYELARPAYVGMAGGGIVVARREVLLECPMDPRFVGWGHEDESLAMALWCLHGDPWRGTEPLIHLWHPLQQRQNERKGSQANWLLRCRYAHQRHNPEGMRALLDEAKRLLDCIPIPEAGRLEQDAA